MISLAILGAGRWGQHLIRNFLALEGVNVVAIVDPKEKTLDHLHRSAAIPPTVALHQDWRSVFTPDCPLEAIVVATPAATHREIIETALQHRLHVLAEKPLTLTIAETQALTDLAQRQGKQLVVDHTYLFHGAVQAGRSQVSRLGTLRYGYASRTNLGPVRLDVDALWDLAIHDLAILGHWLGEMPAQVMGIGGQWLANPGIPGTGEGKNLTQSLKENQNTGAQGLADLVWGTLRYASGLTVQGHWCWHNPDKQRRLALVGDRGTLIFDELAPHPLILQHGCVEATETFPFVPTGLETEIIDFSREEPLAQVCRHFIDCMTTGKPSLLSNGTIAAQLIAPLVALSESLQQGGAWVEVPPS